MQKRDVIRRSLAGAAIATIAALPFAGAAFGQTDTNTNTNGSTTIPQATTSSTAVNTTLRTTTTIGGTGLARTGGDWAVPVTVAGAGVALAIGARRLASNPTL